MKKLFTLLVVVLSLGATSVVQADAGGATLGGILGAVVGSQVGGGNGRMAATAVGAIIGSQVGDNMTKSPQQAQVRRAVYQPPQPQQHGASGDPELEAARANGRAERERAARQQAIQYAYQCGRDGTC